MLPSSCCISELWPPFVLFWDSLTNLPQPLQVASWWDYRLLYIYIHTHTLWTKARDSLLLYHRDHIWLFSVFTSSQGLTKLPILNFEFSLQPKQALIILLQLPKCWDYGYALLCLVTSLTQHRFIKKKKKKKIPEAFPQLHKKARDNSLRM